MAACWVGSPRASSKPLVWRLWVPPKAAAMASSVCGSEPDLPVPDLEICLVHRAPFGDKFFANVIKRVQSGQPIAPVAELVDPRVVLSLPGLVRPESRGWVRLAGSDPTAHPRISANYYGEPVDLAMREAEAHAERPSKTPSKAARSKDAE